MKLVICIIQNEDSRLLQDDLVKEGIRATKLSSTGGFLRSGNTTLLIGVDDQHVGLALSLIKKNCGTRNQVVMHDPAMDQMMEYNYHYPMHVDVGGATVFVLNVDQFEKF